MQDQLEGALYRPPAPTSERLEECQAESEEAIQAAAEQLLREAFDDSLASPPASPQP